MMEDRMRGGSAKLDDDGSLEIEVSLHLGNEAILKAQKWLLFQQPASG